MRRGEEKIIIKNMTEKKNDIMRSVSRTHLLEKKKECAKD